MFHSSNKIDLAMKATAVFVVALVAMKAAADVVVATVASPYLLQIFQIGPSASPISNPPSLRPNVSTTLSPSPFPSLRPSSSSPTIPRYSSTIGHCPDGYHPLATREACRTAVEFLRSGNDQSQYFMVHTIQQVHHKHAPQGCYERPDGTILFNLGGSETPHGYEGKSHILCESDES